MLQGIVPSDTASPEATQALGRELGARLTSGAIVALYGDLGAGKTQLAKGICKGVGINPETVSSPTFTLINEYSGGDLSVYHIDAYRLKTLDEFLSLGYEDYFFGDGITLIEWPERIEGVLPPETIRLRLEHRGRDLRHIAIYDESEGS
ncbi:MAG: tRNA (adenosine(37)-N6)-threonylcarbamoyltransferase complex ATPase subunit type 1 TsaE [Rhodothermia bacterium]|nr:tRNA (adenosine(37)-N6)-threonylcarbamoyltransferase complex ATPase subunit type 1 TsaE [Rhodothermia bacterium]